MKNDRIKTAIDVRLSALHGTPESRERIMRSVKEDRIVKRKLSYTAILVAAMVILLASVALASGLLESVFMQMKGRYTHESVDYEAIHQTAEKDVFDQEVKLPGTEEPMRFSIRESYYDGESVMLGFTYTSPHRPATFDFGPGHEYFDRLESAKSIMLNLQDELTTDEYQEYQQRLANTGSVGIVFYQTGMSDGVYGENGEAFEIGVDDREQLTDGTQWRMLEINPQLPDALRDQDEIGIQFMVVQRPIYYYEDETGSYLYWAFDDRVVVPLTARITRSDADAVRYAQDFRNDIYSVYVEAIAAPAYVKATFTLDVPKEWQEASDEEAFFTKGKSPVDFICDFILVGHGTMVDGELIESGVDTMNNNLTEMSGTYPPLSEGVDALVFRPVYVNSGPHPEEDIVIKITP